MIEKPQLIQAESSGFSPDVMPPSTKKNFSNPFDALQIGADLLSSFTNDIVKPMRETAALEGYQDAVTGMVKERSWLTNDEYQKGIKYAGYNNKLTDMNEKLAAIAKESAMKGEDLAVYNERVKKEMSTLSREFGEIGLEGKLKEQGIRDLMDLPTKALAGYQKQREVQLEGARYRTAKEIASRATVDALGSGNFGAIAQSYDAIVLNGGGTVESQKLASDMTSANMLAMMKGLNMSSEEDRAKAQEVAEWINSEDARKRLDPADLVTLNSAMTGMYEQGRNVTQAQMKEYIRTQEEATAVGQHLTKQGYDTFADGVRNAVKSGVLGETEASSLLDSMHSLYVRGLDKGYSTANILGMKAADRPLNGVEDKEQATAIYAHNTKQFGGGVPAYAATISDGIVTQNTAAVKMGANLLVTEIAGLWNTDPSTMKADELDGTQQKAFHTFMGLARKSRAGNPDLYNALIDEISDPYIKEAVRSLSASNNPFTNNTIQGIREIRILADRYKGASEGKAGSGISEGDQWLNPENMQSRVMFWKEGAGAADFFKLADDAMLANQANTINGHFKSHMGAIAAGNGTGLMLTADQKVAAMLRTKYAVSTAYGLMTMTPEYHGAIKYTLPNGKGANLSAEQMKNLMDTTRVDYHKHYLKGKYNVNNVRMAVEGNFMVVSQLDDDGFEVHRKLYTAKEMSQRAQAQFNKDIEGKPNNAFLTVSARGNSMILTREAIAPFGNAAMATAIYNSLTYMEGIVNGEVDTRDADQKSRSKMASVPTTGIGVSLNHHKQWRAKFAAAGNNPVKRGQVQSAFFAEYFGTGFNMKKAVAALGLPPMDSPDAMKLLPTYIAMSDLAYHAPAAGYQFNRLAKMAREGKIDAAIKGLEAIPQYRESQDARKKLHIAGLQTMYRQGQILAQYAKSKKG